MATFETDADRAREREVADAIEEAWRCELRSFGSFGTLDWYAIREDRMVGVLEVKCRTHALGDFPTVYLSVRKWLALMLASAGLGVPALFVVRFAGGEIRYVQLGEVDARFPGIAGRPPRNGSRNDYEPLIEVPLPVFHSLEVGLA